jgi:hypothetical protein
MRDATKSTAATIEEWKGWDLIKHYHAAPEVILPVEELKKDRHTYWECNRYLYRKDKGILIDTHQPGRITDTTSRSDQVESKELKWAIRAGLKQPFHIDDIPKQSSLRGEKGSVDVVVSEVSQPKPPNKKGNNDTTINKLQADLKKSQDIAAKLEKKIEKLESNQSETAKLKAEYNALKKLNTELLSQNASLSASKKATTDGSTKDKYILSLQQSVQELVQHAKKSPAVQLSSSSGGMAPMVVQEDVLATANLLKRLHSTLDIEKVELEIQAVRESKAMSNTRTREAEMMSIQRQHRP